MRTIVGWVLALLAVVGIGIGIVAGVWSPTTAGPRYGQGVLRFVPCDSTSCGGLVAASPAITDRIVLSSRELTAGQTLRATLVVTNHSGAAVEVQFDGYQIAGACPPRFDIGLTNGSTPPNAGMFLDTCTASHGVLVAPGVTRFSFPVSTSYGGCAQDPSAWRPAWDPVCIHGDVMPLLPPGTYVAVLLGDGHVALPPATSAPVTVLPRS